MTVTGPPVSMHDLSGRVAVVTGGSRGLGREMAGALAGAGADVMVVSRKPDACVAAATQIAEATGRRAVPYACHVGHWDQLEGLVDAAYAEFGRVDVLVNNAGMSPVYSDPREVSEELYDKVLDVNLKGPFRLSALIGGRMAAAEGGSIVNISSVASLRPTPDVLPYAAAKAALNALTVGFAHAWGPKVRVNAIVAGPFLTDVSQHWDMEAFEERAQEFALKRGGRPEEIVGTALYLAGDASSYTTGAVIQVDGGYR